MRPRLTDLNEDQQRKLANSILEFITYDLVSEHMREFNEIHNPPKKFLEWHKKYVRKLERHLSRKGVKLPSWDGTTVIPRSFRVYKKLAFPVGRPPNGVPSKMRGPLKYFGPFIEGGIPAEWKYPAICRADPNENGDMVFMDIMGLHTDVHMKSGGIMMDGASPSAVIFWPFHAFLVDVYNDWKRCKVRSLRKAKKRHR